MLPVIFVEGDCLEWVESSRDQLVWSFAHDIVLLSNPLLMQVCF